MRGSAVILCQDSPASSERKRPCPVIARSHGQSGAVQRRGRQSLAGNLFPGRTLVNRFVNPSVWCCGWLEPFAKLPRMPDRGVQNLRIVWINNHVRDAGVVIPIEGLRPALAAVGGFEYAARW